MPGIEVTYEDGKLSVDPPSQSVGDDGWIVWHFKGLPEGCQPYIKFASGFGPFRSLRAYREVSLVKPSEDGVYIVSKGHLAKTGDPAEDSHEYTAMVLEPDQSEPVATAPGTIDNQATSGDLSPDVVATCTYIPDPDPEEPPSVTIAVHPENLRLNTGDTANWKVTGLRPGDFATLQFKVTAGSPTPMNGPFMSFSLLPGEGSDVRATAMGFVSGATVAPPSFTYEIRVRDQNGKLLGGEDPTIDNIGPPIPPPGDDDGR